MTFLCLEAEKGRKRKILDAKFNNKKGVLSLHQNSGQGITTQTNSALPHFACKNMFLPEKMCFSGNKILGQSFGANFETLFF